MKTKILVIGDNLAAKASVLTAFPNHRFKVCMAPNGTSIRFQLYLIQPDLIVLDAEQPGGHLEETLCEIRERTSVPLIALTAENGVAAKVKTLTCGADACLAQPFSPRELEARSRALLRRSQIAARSIKQATPVLVNVT